ncbi:MAG: hypothetical protein L0Y42_01925, partial [Phycisphaerales bacterium]|nr:hypothetical protein [Phycisphaerales bacterium]
MIVQPDALTSDAPLMLSVSGARGIVGQSMTPAVARGFAAAFASFAREQTDLDQPVLCIGRDSRPSGKELAQAAIEGVNGAGCKAIDLGLVATPTVGVMIQHHGAAGGLVITASHNPGQWNGLKCLNSDGAAPPAERAAEIIRRFKVADFKRPPVPPSIIRDDSANSVHISRVLAAIEPAPIRSAKLKVVLDSINGAGSIAGRSLLEQLGCDVVHINSEPNGVFAHAPEPVEANLRDLAARTRDENAACGFAQDPDADRLAIIDETGRYIGEEYTLVLAAKRVLDLHRNSELGTRNSELIVAANLSTSRMIDDLAAQYPNVRVVRTAVGEANVVAAMQPHGDRAIIGGEGNGGVIFPPVCWVRDSYSAMALVL